MNVILILVDTLRYDFMGFNGNTWVRTPNMDRLARRSLVFDRAYLGSYPCMPARRDLWTGNFEFPFRGWGPLEYNDRDLARVLTSENGIPSMLVTDHYHLWHGGSGNYFFDFTGYDFIRGQENDQWFPALDLEPYQLSKGSQAQHTPADYFAAYKRNVKFRASERDYFPAMVMERAAQWVEENQGQGNYLLVIDCFDPHEPFDPPRHYLDLYDPDWDGGELIWPTYGRSQYSARETQHIRARYAAELTLTDRWLGHFLDTLELTGEMDRSMVVLTTDHGFMLGEHGLIGKPWSAISDSNLYQELVHVPLVMFHPQLREPGGRSQDLVQMVDLFPTVLEVFGMRAPDADGRSLMPILTGSENAGTGREIACFGRFGEAVNLTDGEWTLFIWPNGPLNEPLNWYSQLPPRYGHAHADGPKVPVSPLDRWPVNCARGSMQTQLFNIAADPAQGHDMAPDRPDVVARLKRQAGAFLTEVGAPAEQFERLDLSRDGGAE
jgi:arylsulfatase A-like enzyme